MYSIVRISTTDVKRLLTYTYYSSLNELGSWIT